MFTRTGPYFDFGEMTERRCVDLWLDMDYSRCQGVETHSTMANRAPAPIGFTDHIVTNCKRVPSRSIRVHVWRH